MARLLLYLLRVSESRRLWKPDSGLSKKYLRSAMQLRTRKITLPASQPVTRMGPTLPSSEHSSSRQLFIKYANISDSRDNCPVRNRIAGADSGTRHPEAVRRTGPNAQGTSASFAAAYPALRAHEARSRFGRDKPYNNRSEMCRMSEAPPL